MATGCKSRAPKGPTTTHSPPVARRGLPILQIPAYPDKAPLARGEDTLYRFPLLVFACEARRSSPR
jgi:3-deoxy-D-arabino-heptulosonate 7-phosphate (DAHP) synthase class II